MMEENMISEEIQEVAEPVINQLDNSLSVQDNDSETQSALQEELPGDHIGSDDIDSEQPRDFAKDAAFASLRRQAEANKKEAESLRNILKTFDLDGNSLEELQVQAESYKSGKPVEEVRTEVMARQKVARLEAELTTLRQREMQRVFSDDLSVIKKTFSDVKARDITQLGEDFIKLRANGLDALTAYSAVKTKQEALTKPKPPSTGSVKSSGVKNGGAIFTGAELDALTAKDLDDPSIYEKAMRSMLKL